MKQLNFLFFGAFILTLTGCDVIVKKTIEKNPDIVFDTIKKNPSKFMQTAQEAKEIFFEELAKEEKAKAEKMMEEEFKNPKQPMISDNRAILGPKNAPITIVEYSDFQCPYCSRGYLTIKEVKEKYGDKIRFMYKHLPLPMHPEAMPAAQYFEAIALQSKKKAYKFHDLIFENQNQLNAQKTEFLDMAAKKVGADLNRLKKDIKSEVVAKNIESDMEEARKFGYNGTPVFLVNGVSVHGAASVEQFQKIIDRHLTGQPK